MKNPGIYGESETLLNSTILESSQFLSTLCITSFNTYHGSLIIFILGRERKKKRLWKVKDLAWLSRLRSMARESLCSIPIHFNHMIQNLGSVDYGLQTESTS